MIKEYQLKPHTHSWILADYDSAQKRTKYKCVVFGCKKTRIDFNEKYEGQYRIDGFNKNKQFS